MSKLWIVGAAVLGGLWLGGCATQDYVDKHVAVVQGQVTGLQGQVQGHDAHLTQLDQTTREALERAEAAGKLAEGKFDYSLVLSDDFVTKLKTDNKNVYLEIQGFTDSTGSAAWNLQLGSDRAEAVRRFLNQQGVALNRIGTISYGQDNPVAPNNTRAGRAQNRRVVIVVLE
jgi:outer membrane protein OmpA-like peptidoglycan-associated protein